MSERTRADHLAWCKQRALEYVDRGDFGNAIASMCSDLNKHPDTIGHQGMTLGIMLARGGFMNDGHEVRKWIEGFN